MLSEVEKVKDSRSYPCFYHLSILLVVGDHHQYGMGSSPLLFNMLWDSSPTNGQMAWDQFRLLPRDENENENGMGSRPINMLDLYYTCAISIFISTTYSTIGVSLS